jgi:hypothetical protein
MNESASCDLDSDIGRRADFLNTVHQNGGPDRRSNRSGRFQAVLEKWAT